MRKAVPLDRRDGKERLADFDLIWRVVKGDRKQLSLILPLGPLFAQLELVELLVGDERLDGFLVEASLLRGVGLEHREDRPALHDRAVEFLEAVLLLKVLRGAEDEDALGLVDLRRCLLYTSDAADE